MGIDQILNFLGLAMRASKVKTGESVIVNEVEKGSLKLVVATNDVSNNTAKLIADKCKSCEVLFRKFGNRSESEIAPRKGERVSVGTTDPGLAKRLLSMIDEYREEWLYE